jgi:hypothetical protein
MPRFEIGERAVLEVGELELPRPCARHEIGTVCRDLEHRLSIGVSDDGDDEPARRGYGDADVCDREAQDSPVGEMRVDGPVSHERRRDEPSEDVVHRRLHLALA